MTVGWSSADCGALPSPGCAKPVGCSPGGSASCEDSPVRWLEEVSLIGTQPEEAGARRDDRLLARLRLETNEPSFGNLTHCTCSREPRNLARPTIDLGYSRIGWAPPTAGATGVESGGQCPPRYSLEQVQVNQDTLTVAGDSSPRITSEERLEETGRTILTCA